MRLIIFLLLTGLLPVVAESSEYLLFTPGPFEGQILMPERGKGVLVRRITIKPGDTLSGLSRDFSGKGSYFPQILLFNDIQNPDRIFAGKELLVPVSKPEAIGKTSAPEKKLPPPTKKETSTTSKPAVVKPVKPAIVKPVKSASVKPAAMKPAVTELPAEKASRKSRSKVTQNKQLPSVKLIDKEELDSYAAAKSAFRKEDYSKALTLFSRFLEQYPSSSLVPDASFYKAETLLKLSGQ